MPSITTTLQTVADKKTWMGNFDDRYILFWDGGQKTIPVSTTQQTFQPFSWLLLRAHIEHSPQHLKPAVRLHFSRGRQSFKFLDTHF